MTIGEYNFIVTDLLTGQVKDVVELGSFYWDEIYNAPGAGLATARLDARSTTPENFQDWKTGLWAIKNGEIQWGGIVGKTQLRGETKVLNVPIHGFFHYVLNRFLRSSQGMTYGNLVRISDIEWDNVDQFYIFSDAIDHIQSFEDGDIGLSVTWDALSGVDTKLVHPTFAVKNIGTMLQQLAARQNGFSFYQEYDWEGNVPKVRFRLEYPPHNNTINDVLLYQPERSITVKTPLNNVLKLDGVADRAHAPTKSIAPSSTLELTGLLDLDTYTQGFEKTIVSKWRGSSNQRSARLMLNSSGQLRMYWSTDGIVSNSEDSLALGFTSGRHAVKSTLDLTTGDVSFYVSDDGGVAWTLINTVSGSGATSVFDSIAELEVGSSNHGGNFLEGKVIWAQIFADSTLQAFYDSRNLEISDTSYTDVVGNDWALAGTIVHDLVEVTEEFEPAAIISNVLEYDNDGSDKPVTGLAVIGEGEGTDQKLHYIQNTQGKSPLWESSLSFKDINDDNLLLERGYLALDSCSNSSDQLTLELDRNLEPSASNTIIGSSARVVLRDKFYQDDDLYWIGRKRVTLGENQDEDVTLEVVRRALIRQVVGYGSSVTGGSGQTIVTVTNLNDSGSGSLREALATGNRLIEFAEGLEGGIDLESDLVVDSLDNITIDGDGRVTLKWFSLNFVNCDNFSTKDLKFKRGLTDTNLKISSKSGASRQVRFSILGCDFDGPSADHCIKLVNSFGNSFYGTIAYCKFNKQNQNILIDSGVGENEGGTYFVTFHNNWFHDITTHIICADNCRLHAFNCLFERWGPGTGSVRQGIIIGDNGSALVEHNYVIPRAVGDEIGGEIEAIWLDVFFDQFDTVGDHTVLSDSNYEKYDSVGNAGFGIRALSQIEVVADGDAVSGSNVLRLTAENVGGNHFQGGLAIIRPLTYGQFEARVRIQTDADLVTSGVMISYPNADLDRFPLADNPEGPNPAGGEINWWECTKDLASTRTPIESFVHKLADDAIPPYTYDEHDRTVVNHQHIGTNGTSFTKVVGSITPTEVYVEFNDGGRVVLTDDPDVIPHWNMKPTLQVDAWSNTPPTTPVEMDIDYIAVRSYAPQTASAQELSFLEPKDGATNAIISTTGNILTKFSTETAQNAGSIFTVPYTYYPITGYSLYPSESTYPSPTTFPS